MKHVVLVLMAVVGVAGSAYLGLSPTRGDRPPWGTVALVVDLLTALWWLQIVVQLGRGAVATPYGDVRCRQRPFSYAFLMLAWVATGLVLAYVAFLTSYAAWFGPNPNA